MSIRYAPQALERAVSAVKQRRLTVTQAAREFDVPRKTVDNHVKGVYTRHELGPKRMLSDEEEAALVNYMDYMAGQGFPMTRAMVRAYVAQIIQKDNRKTLFNLESGPSDKWFRSFFKRHPRLTERVPEKFDRSRARMSNMTVMNQYFDLLEETMERLNIKNKPHLVFNADETGWNGKERSHQKVIGVKGRHTYQQATTTSGHITAHMCVSADGRVLPTFLIFEKALPHTTYKDGVPGQWMFATSESGYMDTELFRSWFGNIFLKYCGTERPVLLIMDNHDSHINLEIVELARQNEVELLGLPAHTTHLLQPLDVSINGPIKKEFSSMAARLGFFNKTAIVNKAKFPAVLSHTIDHVCSPAVVKSAFRKCGIFPLNRDAIDDTQLTPSFIKPSVEKGTQEKEGTTCATCGNFFGISPLVKEGLIPEHLSKLFPPVPAKPESARRKLVLEARVITCDAFHSQLQTKKTEQEERKKLVEKRKEEREKRKLEKEKQLSQKKQRKTKKSESVVLNVVLDDVCVVCECACPEGESDNVTWVECDQCKRWFHQVCVGLEEEDVMDDVYFVCVKCCE